MWDETVADMKVIWRVGEVEYFREEDWTTQITLSWLNKFVNWARRRKRTPTTPRLRHSLLQTDQTQIDEP